jgi:hypothetical protein
MRTIDFNGFGFPVRLLHAPTRRVVGEVVPVVQWNAVEAAVFGALAGKPGRLTGNEVRFIRQHLGLTLEAFGRLFGKTHPAVKKWEGAGDGPTQMEWPTEKDIRLRVQLHSSRSATAFRALYERLERLPEGEGGVIVVDCRSNEVVPA